MAVAVDDLADPLEAHLGFSLTPLPHVNQSDRAAEWRSVYDEASKAEVARMAARDIARFGYRFDPD